MQRFNNTEVLRWAIGDLPSAISWALNHQPSTSNHLMTPEQRAKAVVAYFPAIPDRIRADVENVVTRAIRRALAQQLSELELDAERAAIRAEGKGKQAKGRDPSAIHFHKLYQEKFRFRRTGKFTGIDAIR